MFWRDSLIVWWQSITSLLAKLSFCLLLPLIIWMKLSQSPTTEVWVDFASLPPPVGRSWGRDGHETCWKVWAYAKTDQLVPSCALWISGRCLNKSATSWAIMSERHACLWHRTILQSGRRPPFSAVAKGWVSMFPEICGSYWFWRWQPATLSAP